LPGFPEGANDQSTIHRHSPDHARKNAGRGFEIWSSDGHVFQRFAGQKIHQTVGGPSRLPSQSELRVLRPSGWWRFEVQAFRFIPPRMMTSCRPITQSSQGFIGDEFPVAHDCHASHNCSTSRENDSKKRRCARTRPAAQKLVKDLLHEGIQSAGRFVEYEQAGECASARIRPASASYPGHLADLDAQIEIDLPAN